MGWKEFFKNKKIEDTTIIIGGVIIIVLIIFFLSNFVSLFDTSHCCYENITEQQLIQMGQKIAIEEPASGAISIRNIGTYNISATALFVYINRTSLDCNWSASAVAPNGVITADCTCTEGQNIKVTAPGNFDADTCYTE